MTICGYLFLHSSQTTFLSSESNGQRSTISSLKRQPLETEDNMPVPCTAGSCHSKTALYAAGILVGGVAIGYFVGRAFPFRKVRCNTKIGLTKDKVVDTVDVEDIGKKTVYCRCWQSSKFPYCDGSHIGHNKLTGDNLGPLIIDNKKTAQSS